MLGGSRFHSSFIFCNCQADRVHADLCDQLNCVHLGKWFEFSVPYLKRKMYLWLLFCCYYCIHALKSFSRGLGAVKTR